VSNTPLIPITEWSDAELEWQFDVLERSVLGALLHGDRRDVMQFLGRMAEVAAERIERADIAVLEAFSRLETELGILPSDRDDIERRALVVQAALQVVRGEHGHDGGSIGD